jgi:hypothetical protein
VDRRTLSYSLRKGKYFIEVSMTAGGRNRADPDPNAGHDALPDISLTFINPDPFASARMPVFEPLLVGSLPQPIARIAYSL